MSLDERIQDHIHKREYQIADELIFEKMRDQPDSADAHYLKGVSLYFQGNLGPSIEALKKSMTLNPKHTDAAICLSVLYNDIGKYDDAKGIFEKANQSVAHPKAGMDTSVDRKFSTKHLELADLYFRYRRWDEAIEEYGKAAMLDPQTLEIRIRRAKAFSKKGFLSRAIQELNSLKSENSHYIPARLQLGLLHYGQGNILDAELEWETVLELDENNRDARKYLDLAKQNRSLKDF